MTTSVDKIPLPIIILIIVLLISQSLFLFQDARKRNLHPWFWGIWGMFSLPLPTILYLIIERKVLKNKRSDNNA